MDVQLLQRVVQLSKMMRQVLVATVGGEGLPHLSVGERLSVRGEDGVSLFSWSCPQTLSNIQENWHVALVVWDVRSDEGYQLLGEVQAVRDHSVLDGYLPNEAPQVTPQVEHELQVRVTQIMRFSHFAHTDMPLEQVAK